MRGVLVPRRWVYDPSRHAPPRYRRGCAYEAFLADPIEDLDLEIPGEAAGLVSEAEARIAALDRSSPALAALGRLLLRTESIASSRVEGMQADARTLARGEVALDTGRPVGSDVAEILANVDAMQYAIETVVSRPSVTAADLLDIHRVLLERTLPGRAGRVRESQGWIGGNDYNPCRADFVPAPEGRIDPLLDDLSRFCNQERLPPLVQAAIAHAQFETIHPFDDGNGRTGRALVQVILRRRGLAPTFLPPISVVLAAEKRRYVDGLIAFRQDDLPRWLEVFTSAAARAADLAQRYLIEVEELQNAWRARLEDEVGPRADAAAWGVIDVLPGHPVITVAVAVAALDAAGRARSRAAVQLAVSDLETAGVLRPMSSSKRNRTWEADGLLDLVTGLESAVPGAP